MFRSIRKKKNEISIDEARNFLQKQEEGFWP